MKMIQVRELVIGVALATSVASFSASACMVHIATIPGGLQTAHPASVTVSVATRKAIDANSIRDIPRHSKQAKLEALRQIDRRFHELTEVAKRLASQDSLVFSVYLTESNHWTRFSHAHNHWVVEVHQPPVIPSEVVVVLSDTALLNLLDKALKMRDAQALGVLALSGNAGEQQLVIRVFDRFLSAYTTS